MVRAVNPETEQPTSLFRPLEDTDRWWWRWLWRAEQALPLALLAVSTALSLIPEQPSQRRWDTLALAAVAAVAVLLTDTLPPQRWRTRWQALLAFVVLLGSSSVLMDRDLVFLAFMIPCFFRALLLRPKWLMVAGLAASSIMINSLATGGPIAALEDRPIIYVVIVVIQTAAIAGGSELGEQMFVQAEHRRRAVAELEAALEENAGLHQQLLSQAREAGKLDERQRLSQEIHDTLAQGFTGIVTQLQAAREAGTETVAGMRHLDTAAALARENLREARRSVEALRPAPLDDTGLPEAIAGVADRWSERTGVPAEFTTTGTASAMHPEIEATLVRVAQEALTNVGKHANAGRVGLTLSYMEDLVTLDVRDDGAGFDPEGASRDGDRPAGFGLPGMRQRLRRLAGTLAVETEPGGGTAISASVPAISAAERTVERPDGGEP